MELEIAFSTDIGNVREINEDAVYAETRVAKGRVSPYAALLVADGLGGHEGGEVASAMAKTAFCDIVAEPLFAGEIIPEALPVALSKSIKVANEQIFEWGSHSHAMARPGTTMTAAVASPERYYLAHVGDSRAYVVTPQQALQITDDDSVVAEAVRQGLLTDQEAKVSPFRNQLTRSVGTGDSVDPSGYGGDLDEGDVVLLCSDGFSEYISADELHAEVLTGNTLQAICDQFVRTAKLRGGHDNITVAAVRFGNWNRRSDEVETARNGRTKPKAGTKKLSLFKPFG
ncbi:MAG TPA: protein phosphatase 2C domain-containing protein [Capsulimonadaceae bacterium]|jgi:protein phosphatase